MSEPTHGTPSTELTNLDLDLCTLAEKQLYTAVVSDALDQIGMRNQAMREYLRPVYACKPFCGWARTIACSDV